MKKQRSSNFLSQTVSKSLAVSLTLIVVLTMVLCLPHQAEAAQFSDVKKKEWYWKDGWVPYVLDNDLMSGYSGTSRFGPYDNVTRGQMATILYRYHNNKTASNTNNKVSTKFSDVKSGKYYTAAVKWANQKGIITGYDGTKKFGPSDYVTREQAATMIARYARTCGITTTKASKTKFNSLKEKEKVSDWAYSDMVWCASKGVITGVSGKYLDPQGTTWRASMAKIITILAKDIVKVAPGNAVAGLSEAQKDTLRYDASYYTVTLPDAWYGETSFEYSAGIMNGKMQSGGDHIAVIDTSSRKAIFGVGCFSNDWGPQGMFHVKKLGSPSGLPRYSAHIWHSAMDYSAMKSITNKTSEYKSYVKLK